VVAGCRLILLAAMLTSGAAPALGQERVARQFDVAVTATKEAITTDPNQGLRSAIGAERLASRFSSADARGRALATARWLEGEANIRLDRLDRASAAIADARSLARRVMPGSKLEGDVLLSSGTIHGQRAEPAMALRDFHDAHEIYRAINDSRARARALLYIGLLYGDAKDFASALKYLNQALEIADGDPDLLLSIDNNRAVALQELGRLSEADIEFRRALTLARKMGNQARVAWIMGNIADVKLRQGDIRTGEALIRDALRIASSSDRSTASPQLIALAAQAALQRKDYRAAQKLVEQSFGGVNLSTTTLQFREAHETAFNVYRALGDDSLALAHLVALKRLDDRATKLATSANIALAAARFDYANQELRIQTLRNSELRANVAFEKARTQTERNIFLGVALATAAIMAMLATALLIIRRSRNRERAANADLAVTNAALGKALTAKTEFLATTSHEIRTPLNGILGMTQVMLADAHLDGDVRDRIGIVHGAGVTMKALVDDILDVAKMETGNLTVESAPYDLKETLLDAARLWTHQAHAKGVGFEMDLGSCPRLIEGDVARVRQIIFNLLSNALKFTAEGEVSLRATCDGATYSIAVADSGIGIAPDKLDHIFESFRQADAGTTRRFGGTGLGLAICRNLARAMAGEVTVSSEPGRGSCFTVTLPLVDATPLPPAEIAQGAGETVLVVDANPITRAMFKTLLAPHAGTIVAASAISDATELLANGGIHRVLIDGATVPAEEGAAILTALATAAGGAAATTLLWSGTPPAWLATTGIRLVLRKPMAGTALVSQFFSDESLRPPDATLVPRAA